MSEIRNLTRNGETFYPLTTSSAVINEATGEGMIIDETPTAGSDNLVKSGGVYLGLLYDRVKDINNYTSFTSDDTSLFCNQMFFMVNDGKLYFGSGRISTDFLEVSEGMKIEYTSLKGYLTTYAICAFDSNKNLIPAKSVSIGGTQNGSFTVDSSVKYIIISQDNSQVTASFSVSGTVKDLKTNINDDRVEIGRNTALVGDIPLVTNKSFPYYGKSGDNVVVYKNLNRQRSNAIPVKEGDLFLYTMKNTSTIYEVAALDADGSVIQASSRLGVGDSNYTKFYCVPSGVSFLVFCNSADYEASPSVVKIGSLYLGKKQEIERHPKQEDFNITGIYYGGDILRAASYSSMFISAKDVKAIHYRTEYNGGSNVSNIVVFDQSMNVLTKIDGSGSSQNIWVKIPSNAAYILLGSENEYWFDFGIFSNETDVQNAGLALMNHSQYIFDFSDFSGSSWSDIQGENGKESTTPSGNLSYRFLSKEDRFCLSARLRGYGTSFEVAMGKSYEGNSDGFKFGLKLSSGRSYLTGYGYYQNSWLQQINQELSSVSIESGKDYYLTIRKSITTYVTYTVEISDVFGNTEKYTYRYPDFVLQNGWGNIFFVLQSGDKIQLRDISFGYPISPYPLAAFFGHSYVEGDSLRNGNMDKRWAKLAIDDIGEKKCMICGKGGAKWPDILDRLDMQLSWMAGLKYAVFMVGTNDQTATLQELKDYTMYAATVCLSHSTTPVFSTIAPTANGYLNPNTNDYNDWLVKESGYLMWDSKYAFLNADGSINTDAYISDGIHPSVETHQKIYNLLKQQCPSLFNIE